MRVLLDTHALLWYSFGDPHLSTTARDILDSTEHERLVSVATCWEIAIKVSKGRLGLTASYPDFLRHAVEGAGFALLPITTAHTTAVHSLPFIGDHKDPFDRLLVAQAMVENVPLLTHDAAITRYPVTCIW